MTDSLFVTIAHLTLLRPDAYLDHLKPGVGQDNWCALRKTPLQSDSMFPDDALHQAEDDIPKFEANRLSLGSGGFTHKKGNHFQPYPSAAAGSWKQDATKSRSSGNGIPAWRSFGHNADASHSSRGKGRGNFCDSKPAQGAPKYR